MINKKVIVSLLLFAASGLYAQDNIVVAGGEATGVGGSASFTTGQIVYTQKTGTTGSESQGVQQPYELTVTTGLNETGKNIEVKVYPNPSTSFLTLNIEADETENLSYQLINIQGKVIETNKIIKSITNIRVEDLPKSTYFLSIVENNKPIKSFNIIKK